MEVQKTFSRTTMLMLFLIAMVSGAHNAVRIAWYPQGTEVPDNYIQRALAAGYTHIASPCGSIVEAEWTDGEYTGGSSGARKAIKEAFLKAHDHGYVYIPALPSANMWSRDWPNANNPNITYQPVRSDVLDGEAIDAILDDEAPFVQLIAQLVGMDRTTQELSITPVPDYAPVAEGYDKSYKSLIEDVVVGGFNEAVAANPAISPAELEYVHIGNDEPVQYSGDVSKPWKALIGKSQTDLKWMYEADPVNHYGVQRLAIPGSMPQLADAEGYIAWVNKQSYSALTDAQGRRVRVYGDYFYFADLSSPQYKQGVRRLLAEHLKRRVQNVVGLLPDTRCIVHADMLDPEHTGGYLETSGALQLMGSESVAPAGGASVPLNERLILMPWLYKDTYTHHLEGDLTDAKINTNLRKVAVGLTGGWIACGLLPPISKWACRLGVAKYSYESVVNKTDVEVSVTYDARGHRYSATTTLNYFIQNGFASIPLMAFEREEAVSHSLTQMFKVMDAPVTLSKADREKYALGWGCVAWGTEPWDGSTGGYDQHRKFSNMELLAAVAGLGDDGGSSMVFDDFYYEPSLGLMVMAEPVSAIDYLAVTRDIFDPHLRPRIGPFGSVVERADVPRLNTAYFDAIMFCNHLSKREGLQPVYTFTSVDHHSVWDNDNPSLIDNEYDVGEAMISPYGTGVSADLAKDGYRLPTFAEWQAIFGGRGTTPSGMSYECLWGGDIAAGPKDAAPQVPYVNPTASGGPSVSTHEAHKWSTTGFRVVRPRKTKSYAETFDYHPQEGGISQPEQWGYEDVTSWQIPREDDGSAAYPYASTYLQSISPGGWGAMSSCVSPEFMVERSNGRIVEIEFSLRFPTEHGKSWRENNKVWITLMEETGTSSSPVPRYRLLFKPNRRQDQYTSYDLRLSRYDSGTESTLADAWTHTVTPHGASGAWVNFRMLLHPDGDIEVFYDNGTGALQRYMNIADETYGSFTHLRFEYKTGTASDGSNYYVLADNLSVDTNQ